MALLIVPFHAHDRGTGTFGLRRAEYQVREARRTAANIAKLPECCNGDSPIDRNQTLGRLRPPFLFCLVLTKKRYLTCADSGAQANKRHSLSQ